jgi:hypothetical protein
MASIAQAVTTSISGAANQPNADQAAVASPALPVPEGGAARPLDTVNLTETGGRNVSVSSQASKPAAAFQVTYFPPSSAPGAKTADTQSSAAQPAAAVPAQTNNPTAQVANAAAQAAATSNASSSSAAANGAAASQTSPLSAASQAKLQKLDQVLQQLGINPAQVSFADRIALLPLVNDPAAIQQYIQGLPTQTAVLNPATSQVLAPSLTGQPGASQSAAAVAGAASSSAPTANGKLASSNSTSPSTAQLAAAAHSSDTTGQKVNISV